MLTLTIPGIEIFDDELEEFRTEGDFELQLEHSLLSLSKWESKYKKPFLTSETKTSEELFDYFLMMIITPEVPVDVFERMNQKHINEIQAYIEGSRSATWFRENPHQKKSNEIITSELIYYWMTACSIPFECETWDLSRLFALIRVCIAKQSKPEKMSKAEIAARNRELNAQRRKQYGTSG